jgi:hypothetical protein
VIVLDIVQNVRLAGEASKILTARKQVCAERSTSVTQNWFCACLESAGRVYRLHVEMGRRICSKEIVRPQTWSLSLECELRRR